MGRMSRVVVAALLLLIVLFSFTTPANCRSDARQGRVNHRSGEDARSAARSRSFHPGGHVGGAACPVLPVQQGGHRQALGDRPQRAAAESVRHRRAGAEEVGAPSRLRRFQQRHRLLVRLHDVQGDAVEWRRDRGGVYDQELRQGVVQALRNTVQEKDNEPVQGEPQELCEPAGLLPGRAAIHEDDGVRVCSQRHALRASPCEGRRTSGLADAAAGGGRDRLLPGAHAPAESAGDPRDTRRVHHLPDRRLRRKDSRRLLLPRRGIVGHQGGGEPAVPGSVRQGERRVQLRHGAAGDHVRQVHGIGRRPAGRLGGELPERGEAAERRDGPRPKQERAPPGRDREQAGQRDTVLHRPGGEAATRDDRDRQAAEGDHGHATRRGHPQGFAAVVGRARDHLHRGHLKMTVELPS